MLRDASQPLVMPERKPSDGGVSVNLTSHPGRVTIVVEGEGGGTLCLSEYNAWRLIGMLCFLLKVPLTRAAQKAIRF
jgi:hypothetical protein